MKDHFEKMKTTTIALATCFLTFFSLSGTAQPGMGILGGINFASVHRSGFELPEQATTPHRTGMKVGLLVDIPLNERISLQLEPMYLQKGEKFRMEEILRTSSDVYQSTLQMNYLELPALVKAHLSNGAIRPYLVGGGEIGYLLNARQQETFGPHTESFDATDFFKRMDYGLTFGGGVSFPIFKGVSGFVEGRQSIGLANIDASGFEGNNVSTRGLQIIGGIKVPFQQIANNDGCDCDNLTFLGYQVTVNDPKRVRGGVEVILDLAFHYKLKCSDGGWRNECSGEISWERVGANANVGPPKWKENGNERAVTETAKTGRKTVEERCGRTSGKETWNTQYKLKLPANANFPIQGTAEIKFSATCTGGTSNFPQTVKIVVDTTQKDNLDHQASDFDGDGLTGAEEAAQKTDPQKSDTDGDGVNDKNDKHPRNKDKQ